jgi:hypothetical protein
MDMYDLYVEELPDELADLELEMLPLQVAPAGSSLSSFTTFSSFTCPHSTVGTASTASSFAV